MEIAEIKKFFEQNKIPKGFKISDCETIVNPDIFVFNNIYMLENSKEGKWQDIYLKRLLKVIELIKKESQI